MSKIRETVRAWRARRFLEGVPEISDSERAMILACLPHSMASPQRLLATLLACKYVVANAIPGHFVECGVWEGGNSILARMVFNSLGDSREVFLFDTFAGMTEPSDLDVERSTGKFALETFDKLRNGQRNDWCFASVEVVKRNALRLLGSLSGMKLVVGDVGLSLREASNVPSAISVLRLDTDWYDSTKIELETLYPKLARGGVLMIDDYGHWNGARKAVDEFFQGTSPRPFLAAIDYTGRIGTKF